MTTCKTCMYNAKSSCLLLGDGPLQMYFKSFITFETKPKTTLAHTIDAESYHSELIVTDDFGCNQYKEGNYLSIVEAKKYSVQNSAQAKESNDGQA